MEQYWMKPAKPGDFTVPSPEPVKMPDTYSVTYCRLDDEKNKIMTTLERDGSAVCTRHSRAP